MRELWVLLLQSYSRRFVMRGRDAARVSRQTLIGTQTAQWFLGTDNSESLEDVWWGRSEVKITDSSYSENENAPEKPILCDNT